MRVRAEWVKVKINAGAREAAVTRTEEKIGFGIKISHENKSKYRG